MKKVLLSCLVALSVLTGTAVKAQEFELPKNWEARIEEDYAAYEKDIIACANWLENAPLDKDEKKRTKANSFLMKWLTGTSSIRIDLNADLVVGYCEKNNGFLFIFLGGWARFALENSYNKDQHAGYYEGYKSLINAYKKGSGVVKDAGVDKLVELFNKGELQNWIKEKVK